MNCQITSAPAWFSGASINMFAHISNISKGVLSSGEVNVYEVTITQKVERGKKLKEILDF